MDAIKLQLFHGNRVFNQRIQTYKEGGVEFGDIITGITTVRAICHLPNKQLKLSGSSLSPHGSPSPSVLSANSTIGSPNPDSRNPDSRNPDSRNPDSPNPDSRNPDSRNPDSPNLGSLNPGSLIDRMKKYLRDVGEETAKQEATFLYYQKSHLQKLNSVRSTLSVCRTLWV